MVVIVSAGRYFRLMEAPTPAPPHRTEARLETLRAATAGRARSASPCSSPSPSLVEPTLAAFLAGILAGMGTTALITATQILLLERELGGRLLVDGRARAVYLEPAGTGVRT